MPPVIHAIHGERGPNGWRTLCGDYAKGGGVSKPGPGMSLRDAGVDCPGCLEFDVIPIRPRQEPR